MMLRILFICLLSTLPALANAACPAAPVGSSEDRVIQMVAGADGVTQMAKESVLDATEEGAIVYDATNNTIAVCDGTDWVPLSGGSGDNLGSGGTTAGQIGINNAAPTLFLQDNDHRSGMIHVNSDRLYILTADGTNSTTWAVNGAHWPFVVNLTNDNIAIGGNMYFAEGELSMGNAQIKNVANPTAAQDAATKAYVDSQAGGGLSGPYHCVMGHTGCPTGYHSRGLMGVISPTAGGNCPIGAAGAHYSDQWHWCHPIMCCK